jgi:methionine-rich copper-binding protein CopC
VILLRVLPLAVCALAALAPALPAAAHAFLVRAEPRVGATVANAPPTLRLHFTEALEAPFSRVTVSGPPGFGGAGPARALPGDHAGLAVDLRAPTPAGAYTVHWRVLAADTHVTQGDFSFKVQP